MSQLFSLVLCAGLVSCNHFRMHFGLMHETCSVHLEPDRMNMIRSITKSDTCVAGVLFLPHPTFPNDKALPSLDVPHTGEARCRCILPYSYAKAL